MPFSPLKNGTRAAKKLFLSLPRRKQRFYKGAFLVGLASPAIVAIASYPLCEMLTQKQQDEWIGEVDSKLNVDFWRCVGMISAIKDNTKLINEITGDVNKFKLATDYCAIEITGVKRFLGKKNNFFLSSFLGKVSCYFPIITERGVALLKVVTIGENFEPIKIELVGLNQKNDLIRSLSGAKERMEKLTSIFHGLKGKPYILPLPEAGAVLFERNLEEADFRLLEYEKNIQLKLRKMPISVSELKYQNNDSE